MSLSKPFEDNNLQNSTQIIKNSNGIVGGIRSAPVLPPRPTNSPMIASGYNSGYNAYNMPYSGMGMNYSGGLSSYGSYGMPYRSSMYNTSYGSSYGGGYGSYGSMGLGGSYAVGYGGADDHERRFIQYAEESSRNTFSSVESIVRAFNSLAMMLDNTFFAMTSSFRAVLSVAENFGRLRTMFGHIWYSINIFRFVSWMYRKLLRMLGYKLPPSTTAAAWKQATSAGGNGPLGAPGGPSATSGSSWPTIAFLGMLLSAPYIISKFLPKYEDKGDPANWKTPGIRAKAAFDFIATSPNELTVQTNDMLLLAPTYIQEEMHLKNSGWAFAVCKGKSGVVPLNYLVISKCRPISNNSQAAIHNESVPIPRNSSTNSTTTTKTHTKRVSFGENQIFENVDIDDYIIPTNNNNNNKEIKSSLQTKKVEDINEKDKAETNEKTAS